MNQINDEENFDLTISYNTILLELFCLPGSSKHHLTNKRNIINTGTYVKIVSKTNK